jgi:hypothetical protein
VQEVADGRRKGADLALAAAGPRIVYAVPALRVAAGGCSAEEGRDSGTRAGILERCAGRVCVVCGRCGGALVRMVGLWFHDLRRSFVTNARRRGVAESVVMKMSGHKTRAIFDRYNIINDEDLRTGIERIEEGRRAELAAQAKTAASTRAVRRAGGGGKKMDQG